LSIVKHLVELHGGTVRAKSAGEGEGATFIVGLPLDAVRAGHNGEERVHPGAAGGGPARYECPDLSGVRVLVVDDEPDARLLVKRILEECKAQVLTAASAVEALEGVTRERPDVLVSDIGMPGVDGYELLRRVRALGAEAGGNLPAVALTAFARAEDRLRALRVGYHIHVAKPVEPMELMMVVASAAGRTGNTLQVSANNPQLDANSRAT
jgi:CheY-like chemotaxis protein